mgnify:CR=1 FL=1
MASLKWFWLSFCDTNLPKGSQWLGCCLISAPSFMAAVFVSHVLGVNPGGELTCDEVKIPHDHCGVNRAWVNRLITDRQEAKQIVVDLSDIEESL